MLNHAGGHAFVRDACTVQFPAANPAAEFRQNNIQ